MTKTSSSVTPAMVAAGLKILRESGALAYGLSGDHLLIRAILEAAFQSQRRARKTPEKHRRPILPKKEAL